MKAHRLLVLVTFVCVILSLTATLVSYNFYYTDPHVVDAAHLYRGWPICWIIESWPVWNPPTYAIFHSFYFQPINFLIDIVFWAVVFQLPSVILLLLKGVKETKSKSLVRAEIYQ